LPLRKPNDLSLALGTDEVTLHDLTLAYTPLANGGLRPEARTIIGIHDRPRNSSMEIPPQVTQVLSPAAAFVTTRMLQDVLDYGTARSLQRFGQERPAAGKTGTTDDYRDAWFIGYTPQMITGVWVGHDQPRPGGRSFTGGAIAAPIWERFMRQALAAAPASDFLQPEGVVRVYIDTQTGYLAGDNCPDWREEYFIAGSEPTDYCPEHGTPAREQPAPTSLAPVAEE
jgi:membrane carboxypeptidase/penicillin-binding protein